jgi:arylformamidase
MCIDLSHTIEAGMTTYRGLPGPVICDYLSREASRGLYEPGTEFQIGKIEMVSNTGTYIDTPFHRYADGADLAAVSIERLANLPALVLRIDEFSKAITPEHFAGLDLAGKAILVDTGWSRHWRTETYLNDHPFLTEQAAIFLRDAGVSLVGIDSHNIDDTSGKVRPVHTTLLGSGIPIVEHLTELHQLPDAPFRFFAVPPKIVGMGTFPVRAFAIAE